MKFSLCCGVKRFFEPSLPYVSNCLRNLFFLFGVILI